MEVLYKSEVGHRIGAAAHIILCFPLINQLINQAMDYEQQLL